MRGKFLKKGLALCLSAIMTLGNVAPVCAAEAIVDQTAKTDAPTVTVETDEKGVIERVIFQNNDVSVSAVQWGLATKEQLENGWYSSIGRELEHLEIVSEQLEWLVEENNLNSGEYYIFAYAESNDEERSELVVLENYPIKIIKRQKDEPIYMQEGNITGNLYFPEENVKENSYAFLKIYKNNSMWSFTSVLEAKNGIFYFDPTFYNEYYNDGCAEGITITIINVEITDAGHVIEHIVYDSVVEGAIYEEPRADSPVISLRYNENGDVTGYEVTNSDEEYSLVCYGIAKKEDIEAQKNIDFLGDFLEPSQSIGVGFLWCITEYANKAGEYYLVAYTSNDNEERSELAVLKDYPIIVTDTYIEDPLVCQLNDSGKIMSFSEKTSEKYDYGKINITGGNLWTWSLSTKEGVYCFYKEFANLVYDNWAIKEVGFGKITPGDTSCVVEEIIYTSVAEESGSEKPEPEYKDSVTKVFSDVSEGGWYVNAVQYVYDNGIMSGNNGLFNPNGNITRAQVVTTLYNLESRPTVTDYRAVEEMVDVQAGQWYTDAVCWAYSAGVANGNSSTKMFNMSNPVTRQQLATFFYNYAEYRGFDTKTREDISGMAGADQVASYALDTMQWAVGTGLISGSATTVNGVTVYDLKPTGTATRAQIASILQRFCEKNNI